LLCEFGGEGREGLKKKERVKGRNRGHWKDGLWRAYVSSKYKTLFIWKGLYQFFKFNYKYFLN